MLTPVAVSTSAYAQSSVIEQNRIDRRTYPFAYRRPRSRLRSPRSTSAFSTPFKSFVLRHVVVDGSSLPLRTLQGAWASYLGRSLALADVNHIADAAASIYSDSNVALYTVDVPKQDFTTGMLHLHVQEDYISAVVQQPDAGVRVGGVVERLAHPILREHPLARSSLDRFLGLVRALPGVTAEAELVSGELPGEVRLKLALHQRRAEVQAEVNNTGQAVLGRTQVAGTLKLNSVIRPGDETDIITLDSPDFGRLRYVGLSHAEPLLAGATAQVDLGYLATNVQGVHGEATSIGFKINYLAHVTTTRSLSFSVGLDGLNNDDAFLEEAFSHDHTRAVRVSALFSEMLDHRSIVFSGSISQGVSIFGASVASPLLSDQTFTKVAYNASLDQTFSDAWVVRFRSLGQFSEDALPTAELIALGGPVAGRAFDSVVAVGDSGLYASGEVARTFKAGNPRFLLPAELYIFADAGYARYNSRVSSPALVQYLSSAGVGTRMTVLPATVLELEGARATAQQLYPDQRTWKFNFNLRTAF